MAVELPRVVVNFKTYPESTARRAAALAKAARDAERRTGVRVAVAVQAVDVDACVATRARVYAQHVDPVASNQSTGATRWESLVAHGVEGTLINHSEKRLPAGLLARSVALVRASGLVSLVCARDAAEAARLARLKPSLIAVEPPELIGGDVSVTTADPEIVRRTVLRVHRVAARLPVLCGAGVKDGRDVVKARELGAYGILVASGVVKAARPARILGAMARAAREPRGDNP